MSILKKPYEISAWDDVWNADTGKFEEQRIAIIGTDTMLSQSRALDPVLTTDVNGKKTLTFNMYKKYIDTETGDTVINPFSDLLENERKVKLYYKDKWYDFLVKSVGETSTNYLQNYSLEDAQVSELSKNGYNVTLDTELENNLGTAKELGEKVLKNTDWLVESDILVEEIEEPLVHLKLKEKITAYEVTQTTKGLKEEAKIINLEKVPRILAFYSCCQTKPRRFQFFVLENNICNVDAERILQTNVQYYIDINSTDYTEIEEGRFYIPKQFEVVSTSDDLKMIVNPIEGEVNTSIEDTTISYLVRGKRFGYTQKTVYNSKLDKWVNIYLEDSKDPILYYGYNETEVIAPNLITNLITNDTFDSTVGWTGTYLTNSTSDTYPSVQDKIENIQGRLDSNDAFHTMIEDIQNSTFVDSGYASYLKITIPTIEEEKKVNGFCILNSGFYDRRGEIETLTTGDKFCIRCAGFGYKNGKKTELSAKEITPNLKEAYYNSNQRCYVVKKDTKIAFDCKDWALENGEYFGYFEYTGPTLSKEEFSGKRIMLSLSFDNRYPVYFISLIQLFKYYKKDGVNSTTVKENHIPCDKQEIQSKTIDWHYYIKCSELEEKSTVQECEVLKYEEYQDSFKPVYIEHAQKFRMVSAKQSNYFNILSTIAETFECWLDLEIERDVLGTPKRRIVRFKKYVGEENYAGFKYGVNLQNITRQLNSKAITTKLIVPANNNEYAEDGICTIRRAKQNVTGEDYLYNFDYYGKRGLLDLDEFIKYTEVDCGLNNELVDGEDSIKPKGYYECLKEVNNKTFEIEEQLIEKTEALVQLNADIITQEGIRDSSRSNFEKATNDFYGLTLHEYNDLGEQWENLQNPVCYPIYGSTFLTSKQYTAMDEYKFTLPSGTVTEIKEVLITIFNQRYDYKGYVSALGDYLTDAQTSRKISEYIGTAEDYYNRHYFLILAPEDGKNSTYTSIIKNSHWPWSPPDTTYSITKDDADSKLTISITTPIAAEHMLSDLEFYLKGCGSRLDGFDQNDLYYVKKFSLREISKSVTRTENTNSGNVTYQFDIQKKQWLTSFVELVTQENEYLDVGTNVEGKFTNVSEGGKAYINFQLYDYNWSENDPAISAPYLLKCKWKQGTSFGVYKTYHPNDSFELLGNLEYDESQDTKWTYKGTNFNEAFQQRYFSLYCPVKQKITLVPSIRNFGYMAETKFLQMNFSVKPKRLACYSSTLRFELDGSDGGKFTQEELNAIGNTVFLYLPKWIRWSSDLSNNNLNNGDVYQCEEVYLATDDNGEEERVEKEPYCIACNFLSYIPPIRLAKIIQYYSSDDVNDNKFALTHRGMNFIRPAVDLSRDDASNLLREIYTYQKAEKDAVEMLGDENIPKSGLLAQKKEADEQIKKLNSQLDELDRQKDSYKQAFYSKYHRFIQEGTWMDESYIDSEKYYIDAQSTLYNSCYPQVTYSIKTMELSQLPGYELFSFGLGDTTFVEDPEFFGEEERVEVAITSITERLDNPSQNTIKVQNFKNQFQDLFQKITATTQQVSYATGAYEKAVTLSEGKASQVEDLVSNSIGDISEIIKNAGKQSVKWGDNGIIITDLSNPCEQLQLIGGEIKFGSQNQHTGEITWTTGLTSKGISASLIRAGRIDVDNIQIMAGNAPTFRWDAFGITAYHFQNSGTTISDINLKKFVRFDRFGFYGAEIGEDGILKNGDYDNTIQDGSFWKPESLTEINDNATFSLTWQGLKVTGDDGVVALIGKTANIKDDDDKIITYGNIFNITKTTGSGDSKETESLFKITNNGDMFIKGHIDATSGTFGKHYQVNSAADDVTVKQFSGLDIGENGLEMTLFEQHSQKVFEHKIYFKNDANYWNDTFYKQLPSLINIGQQTFQSTYWLSLGGTGLFWSKTSMSQIKQYISIYPEYDGSSGKCTGLAIDLTDNLDNNATRSLRVYYGKDSSGNRLYRDL